MSISAVFRCHEDSRIFDCIADLESNDCEHEVVAVVTETSQDVAEKLGLVPNCTVVTAPVGNLSRSSNMGIAASRYDRYVMLDCDLSIGPRYLDIIDKALDDNVLVKSRINFGFSNFPERLVAELRTYVHQQDLAYCPGLAFRHDLADKIDGHFFNDRVWWTEDAELNFRIKRAGIPLFRADNAVLCHDPEGWRHDLSGAYKIGRGKHSQVVHAGRDTFEENAMNVLRRLLSGEQFKQLLELAQKASPETAIYSMVWDLFYYLGYYRERIAAAVDIKS